jgi:hypothetical protein
MRPLAPPAPNTTLQLVPQVRPPSLCPRKPPSRNHRLASPAQTPRHQGHIYQRPRKGHLCTQSGERADHEEGRTLARRQRRQVEKGHQARQEYQRKCQRYLGSFPRLKVVCLIDSVPSFTFLRLSCTAFTMAFLGIPRAQKECPLQLYTILFHIITSVSQSITTTSTFVSSAHIISLNQC